MQFKSHKFLFSSDNSPVYNSLQASCFYIWKPDFISVSQWENPCSILFSQFSKSLLENKLNHVIGPPSQALRSQTLYNLNLTCSLVLILQYKTIRNRTIKLIVQIPKRERLKIEARQHHTTMDEWMDRLETGKPQLEDGLYLNQEFEFQSDHESEFPLSSDSES